MSHRSTYIKGKDAFLAYYQNLFPSIPIDDFLSQNNQPVLLFSPDHLDELRPAWNSAGLSWKPLAWFPQALVWPPEVPVGTPLPGYEHGWLYSLNPASLLPILALDPQPHDNILDTCAAPGGKTLAIRLHAGPIATIYANDSSLPRFKRLRTVMRLFGEQTVETRNFPAQTLSRLNQKFDRILIDAPCSSEKHVYNSKHELKIWSPKRISTLAHQQFHLIKNLLPLLNPSGRLVYSTCAISPEENEQVIAKTLNQLPTTLLPLPNSMPITGPGLPNSGLSESDRQKVLRINQNDQGFDPMFVALLSGQN